MAEMAPYGHHLKWSNPAMFAVTTTVGRLAGHILQAFSFSNEVSILSHDVPVVNYPFS